MNMDIHKNRPTLWAQNELIFVDSAAIIMAFGEQGWVFLLSHHSGMIREK